MKTDLTEARVQVRRRGERRCFVSEGGAYRPVVYVDQSFSTAHVLHYDSPSAFISHRSLIYLAMSQNTVNEIML